jgi:hypothetical protein
MGCFTDVQCGERQHYQRHPSGEHGGGHGEDQRGQRKRHRHRDHHKPGRLRVDIKQGLRTVLGRVRGGPFAVGCALYAGGIVASLPTSE